MFRILAQRSLSAVAVAGVLPPAVILRATDALQWRVRRNVARIEGLQQANIWLDRQTVGLLALWKEQKANTASRALPVAWIN